MSAAQIPEIRPLSVSDAWKVYGSMIRRERVLALAYHRRACFVCGARQECEHREPNLETVIAQRIGIGADLK